MKNTLIFKVLIAGLCAFAICSCNKENEDKSIIIPASIDGLWVKDCQIDGNAVVPHIEIKGNSAIYCRAVPEANDYSDCSHASVNYNNETGAGQMAVSGGAEFTFLFDGAGTMVTSDGDIFFPVQSSIDELAALGSSSFSLSQDPDLVGPTEYHDLSIDQGLLSAKSPLYLQSAFLDMMEWVVKKVAEGAVKGTGSKGVQELYDLIFKADEMKQMNDMLQAVNEINDKLSELIDLYHNSTYEKYLNDRINLYISPMNNYNELYKLMIEDCDGTEDAIREISAKWANTSTISGNSPTVQFLNFIDFLRGTVVEQKNLYQIYDTYVFNTHAWECEGYAIREALRATDLAVIAESAFLAIMYAKSRTDISDSVRETLLAQINTAIESYQSFSNANLVERNDMLSVCQISGAHFRMEIGLEVRDYYDKPWFPNRTVWENEDSIPRFIYGSKTSTPSTVKSQLMTNTEISKIFAYYKDSKYSNFWDVMTQAAKCNHPFTQYDLNTKQIFFVTQDGGYYTRYDGTIFRFGTNNAIVAKDGFKRANTDFGKGELETVGFFCKDRVFAGWTSYNDSYLWVIPHIIQRY